MPVAYFQPYFVLFSPVLPRRKKYMISPQGLKNERNCNILQSESQFLLLHINFVTHFDKIQKIYKAAGRVNILRRIRSSIDTLSAQRIHQSMTMSIFTYCRYNSLGWSEPRRSMIRSIEKRSLEIISPKCSRKNCDLRFLMIDKYVFAKESVLFCIWLPPQNGTACFPFSNYFQRFHHNSLNTRNNGKAAKLPKVKLEFTRCSFNFLGASIHCH